MARTSLLSLCVSEYERWHIARELEANGWNRKRTASELGISYRALLYKIKRHALRPPSASDEILESVSGNGEGCASAD